MIKINKHVIFKLNPCKDRFDNYVKHYGDKEFTPRQFMGLKNITHEDKMWVALRLIDKSKLRFIAADIAESVLHLFEKYYPYEFRPRFAIEAARKKQPAPYFSAYDAYSSAVYCYDEVSNVVAASAALSAASAAYSSYYNSINVVVVNHAYNAAVNAAIAVDAAHVGYSAYVARLKQEKLQRTIILKYWLKDEK